MIRMREPLKHSAWEVNKAWEVYSGKAQNSLYFPYAKEEKRGKKKVSFCLVLNVPVREHISYSRHKLKEALKIQNL